MRSVAKKRSNSRRMLQIALIAYSSFTVLLPLVKMLTYIEVDSLERILLNQQFIEALVNSISVTSVATFCSILLAYMLAWCLSRTGIKFKSVFAIFLTVPMLVPSISHSTGIVMLFGSNGFFTNLFSLNHSIYGFWGIVLGSMMYSFPFAFLMIHDVLRYEDYTPYEAANVLGIPKWKQTRDITLSYLAKPMTVVIFSTFTIIFTDYGVPIAIGGKFMTLPVIMYQEVIGQLNFGKGSIIGTVLLIPAIISFIIDTVTKENKGSNFITKSFEVKQDKLRDFFSYSFCGFVCLFILFINLSFVILAFTKQYPIDLRLTLANAAKTFDMNGMSYLLNSLLIAVLVSVLGTIIGFITAYMTARVPSLMSKSLHLLTITSLSIPGVVLGLAYILFFKATFLYGTIALLVMVNMTHFLAAPYLMMYNTLGKMNENLEAVGDTLGVSRVRMVLDVFIPQVKSTLLEMVSYLFVNSMITISAVSFLATTTNKPFSLLINQFDALMVIECSAFVSIVLLFVNILVKAVIYTFRRRSAKFA